MSVSTSVTLESTLFDLLTQSEKRSVGHPTAERAHDLILKYRRGVFVIKIREREAYARLLQAIIHELQGEDRSAAQTYLNKTIKFAIMASHTPDSQDLVFSCAISYERNCELTIDLLYGKYHQKLNLVLELPSVLAA